MPVEPTKYLSVEEEAAQEKSDNERREKAIDEAIKRMPSEFFRSEYLEEHGEKYVSANLLSKQLARAFKRSARLCMEVVDHEGDRLWGLIKFQRDRCRVLAAKVEELETRATDFDVSFDGERSFSITAGGKPFRFTLPVTIFRDTWRDDGRYERGDMVSHNGSLWVAVDADPAHQPGQGPKWRLAAMRGRNGKDASRNPRSQT